MSTERTAWTADEAFDVIARAWNGGRALLGSRMWRAADQLRFGFLPLRNHRPVMVWDGYLHTNEADRLRAKLGAIGEVADGCFDFMHATRWKVAWTSSEERIEVYSRSGLRGCVTRDHAELAGGRQIARAEIAGVHGEGEAFRARTRVRLWLVGGRTLTLVSAYDVGKWFHSDDPWGTYEVWPQMLVDEIRRLLLTRPR